MARTKKDKNVKLSKRLLQKWARDNKRGAKGELYSIVLVKEEMQKLIDRALMGYVKQQVSNGNN